MNPKNFDEFDPKYIYEVPAGTPITFEEKGKGGEGESYFKSVHNAIVIRAPKRPPSVWGLKTGKFSEGAFLTIDKENMSSCLHVLEMKSKLTADTFDHALDQLKSAYLASLGIIGILRLPTPNNIKFYIAYSELALENSQIAYLKTPVGGEPPPALAAWRRSSVRLADGSNCQIIKGLRNGGSYNFGIV